jgi:hypothetical protein
MGGYVSPLPTQVSQDPNNPSAINPYATYGYPGAYGGFLPSDNQYGGEPMQDIYTGNANQISDTGSAIAAQGANELNYYGPLQQQYTGAEDQALNNLQQTPGFTPDQASQINTDYSQYNTTPDQYSQEAGDPNAPVNTLNAGVSDEGAMLNQYQANLGGEVGQYGQDLSGAVSQFGTGADAALSGAGTGVGGAVSGLQSGLASAQGAFDPLNTAVNNKALGFDPNSTEQQLTPQQQQAMVTAAGTTVGNQFQTAEDTLERQAAAQGNTSPAALAALRQQLVTQEAATAGDTMTQASIAAEQAGFQQASSIEQQREGAVQAQTGLQATAATTEEAAAQAAAGLGGQAAIGAQQTLGQEGIGVAENVGQQQITAANNVGQANINAANTYGQFSTGEENTMANQQYGAQATAEQEAAARAAQIAQQQYGQGTGSAQLTSQGAQTVGAAQQAGEAAYRSGVAGQESQAQQGGQSAQQTELGAYGTQTSGINSAASSQGNFSIGKPSLGDQLGKSVAGLFAEGGVAFEPQIARLGESGPEAVIPIGPPHQYPRYKSFRKAA